MITVVGNLKGGSGKSTVAFNLAVWLAAHDIEVTVFDLDPQSTLADVTEVREEQGFVPRIRVKQPDAEQVVKLVRRESAEVIIDVGTADMLAMRAALAAANRILVPVAPSQADVWSTQRFLGVIQQAGGAPEVLAFINRGDTHHAIRETDEAAEALAMIPGAQLMPHRLHQRTAYRRSFSEGLGVFELEPAGKAAHEFEAFCAALYPVYARQVEAEGAL